MNVHHLELFYYVARHGGIVAATRQIPYGVGQPAVSAQVARLEEDLGVRLFERRPFRLTPAGRALYDFAAPFFGRLGEIEDLVRGKLARTLRLAGLTEVMRGHVPAVLEQLRARFPGLKVTLHEIDQRGAERLISDGEADLAITVLEGRLPAGFRSRTLAELPLCLLVPAGSPYRKAGSVLDDSAKLELVSLPPHELLPRIFARELARRGRSWKTAIETSAQELVAIYVSHGHGVGLGVITPDLARSRELKCLPLAGFPSLKIGAFWRGKPGEIASALLDGLDRRSREIFEKFASRQNGGLSSLAT